MLSGIPSLKEFLQRQGIKLAAVGLFSCRPQNLPLLLRVWWRFMPDAQKKGQDFKILKSALGGEWVAGEKKVDCFSILKYLKAWECLVLAYKLSNTPDIATIKLKIQKSYLLRVGFLLVTLFSWLQENVDGFWDACHKNTKLSFMIASLK